jgi:hypothetical protein
MDNVSLLIHKDLVRTEDLCRERYFASVAEAQKNTTAEIDNFYKPRPDERQVFRPST